MLNPALDIEALRNEFARERRVRVRNVLAPEVADAIAAEMAQLPYKVFCATGKGVAVIDPQEMAQWDRQRQIELQRALFEAASRAEGFAYFGYRMTEQWQSGAPDNALGRFYRGLQGEDMIAAIRTITGASTFDTVFAQATDYRPGHYLTRHLDDPKGEHRKFAFVWGFTRTWDPDWGGLLQFFDNDGQPTQSCSPGFNTLDLFDVSHIHSVTLVAPYALNPRHAVSGWFVKGDPLHPMGYTHTKNG
ncbi:MAG TPA: 2OG-Fe(II) oxygenase family protein [Hyphomonadaceae bacterium]|nr:2OG-Fe(II) oxygenase family protein [Hyphomonadaceae bacterium]